MTYLQGIYADLIAAGYSRCDYIDGDQLKSDMANRNRDDAFARLYLYWYKGLCKISRYPLRGCSAAYVYNSTAEQSDVEQEILSAWMRIMQLSIEQGRYYGQTAEDIRRQVVYATKQYAQDAIRDALGYTKIRETIKTDIHDAINPDYSTCDKKRKFKAHFKRMVIPMVKSIDDMPIAVADTANMVVSKDTARFIADKIEAFLANKSPEYRTVFRAMLVKTTVCEYGGKVWELKQTEASVADDIGKPKHVVTSLKIKIRKDFAPYWETEIRPYI